MHPLLDRLRQEGLSMVVTRDGQEIYRSRLSGVGPLLSIWQEFPGGLAGATVADRVVGGCAARVFAHLGVGRILALVGSTPARAILAAHGIPFEVEHGVLEIRNRNETDTCPFEQLGRHHTRAEELVPAMRDRLEQLRRGQSLT